MLKIETFTGKVTEKRYITTDVMLLSLKIPETFQFQAGQFVNIKVEKDSEYKMKSYSILNPPNQKGQLDLCIKILPDGFASEVFKNCKVDDEFEIKGPFGHFVFVDDERKKQGHEHWFLGAGTGVAPLYSMILEHLTKHPEVKFHLIFGTKTKKDVLFEQEFSKLQQQHHNFSYEIVLSREQSWDGKKGHVQEHLPQDQDGLKNKTFYICGLKELVLETKDLLLSKNVAKENIKFERYS